MLVGYCGQISLGTRRLHGGRRLRRLQPRAAPAVAQSAGRRVPAGGLSSRPPSASLFGLPQPAHQGLLPRRRDPGGAVLRRLGVPPHPWFTNYTPSGSVNAPPLELFGFDLRHARPRSYLFCLAFAVRARARRQEPRARPHRPRVDGDPRHGHRRRDHRHRPAARQAHRLRRQLVHDRRAGALWAFVYLGSWEPRGLLDRPLVPAAVHGHHRRAGLDPGQRSRRRLHRAAADLPQPACRRCSASGWISTAMVSHSSR